MTTLCGDTLGVGLTPLGGDFSAENQLSKTDVVTMILVLSAPGREVGLLALIKICQISTVSWFNPGSISQETSNPSCR